MIILYDMKDHELPVLIFDNYKELAKYFNSTVKSMQCFVCRKTLIKRKYLAIRYDLRDLEE